MLIYLLEYANNLMSSSASFRKTTLIDGIMASVIAASAVDRGFESRSGQTKHYKIGMFVFLIFWLGEGYYSYYFYKKTYDHVYIYMLYIRVCP